LQLSTAIMVNAICTVQIASHRCCAVLAHNTSCTLQIAGHPFHTAMSYSVFCTVKIANLQCITEIPNNTTAQCKLQVVRTALQKRIIGFPHGKLQVTDATLQNHII